jgi:hypothetical protein
MIIMIMYINYHMYCTIAPSKTSTPSFSPVAMVGSTPRCRMTCATTAQVPVGGGVEPHRKIVLHTTNYCNICVYIYAYIDLYLTIYLYYAIIYIGLYRNHRKNDLVSLLCIIVWAAQTSVAIEYI